jgi:hypothetical protein
MPDYRLVLILLLDNGRRQFITILKKLMVLDIALAMMMNAIAMEYLIAVLMSYKKRTWGIYWRLIRGFLLRY